jgi:hypothetical protein
VTGPGPDHELEALLSGAESHEPGSVDWAPGERPAPVGDVGDGEASARYERLLSRRYCDDEGV